LRVRQRADDPVGRETISDALTAGLEEGPRIVVADKMDETQLGVPGVINVSALAKDQKREALIAADPHILIVRSKFQVDAELMSRLSHLGKVIRGGHGLDNIDLSYAASRDIEVRGTGGSEPSVTAWTVQAIGRAKAIRLNAAPTGPAQASYPLGFARSDWEAAQKEKAAEESPDSQPMLEQKFDALFQPVPGPAWDALRGETVGIIGFGRIGKTIASTARNLGMNVLAYAPSLEADPAPAQALGARFATKEEIYGSAHYVVLITGLYKKGPRRNVGMVGKAEVKLMLENKNLIALIDPTARAGLVVEPEIVKLVMAGAQYFVDGLPEHPYLRETAQFTPHIGASTPQAKRQVIAETAVILREFVDELSAQAGPSAELRTGLEEVQQALEQLGTLEQVWKAPPAVEAPPRPILLDATDEEAVRHLGQALAIFLGRDNRADRILDFRLVIPESLRERTMNELSQVDLKLALHFLEGRLVSYDGIEKSRSRARQEAASALVPDLPAGETPQDLARRGELLLVESVHGDLDWALQLRRYLEPAGLQIRDDATQRLKVLFEAA